MHEHAHLHASGSQNARTRSFADRQFETRNHQQCGFIQIAVHFWRGRADKWHSRSSDRRHNDQPTLRGPCRRRHSRDGGGTAEMAAIVPPEEIKHYPEPTMFGNLPASGFFVRHCKNIEFCNVELAWSRPDLRPHFWMQDVEGVDVLHLKLPRNFAGPRLDRKSVSDFN